MSKIFIHLGAHKTATSFIQANLRANTAAFEKQGWKAIDFQTEFKKARTAVVKLRANRPLETPEDKHLRRFFKRVRKDSRDIFLSYEGFLGAMNMRKGQIYRNHATQIAMLKESFAGRDIQIGFCVRNFADQAESSYSFRIVKGRMKRGFDKYAKKISTDELSWLKIVENLADAFGSENLVLWTYEDFKKDSMAAFLKILEAAGVDTAGIALPVTAPRNVSPTIEQVRLLRAWHKGLHSHLDLSRADTRRVKHELRTLVTELPRAAESPVTARHKVLPTAEQARLLRIWHKALHSHLKLPPASARMVKHELRTLAMELPLASEAPATAPHNALPTVEQVRLMRVWQRALRSHLRLSPANAHMVKSELRTLLAELPIASTTKGRFEPERRKKLTEHYEQEVAVIREKWGNRILDFAPVSPPGENTTSPEATSLIG